MSKLTCRQIKLQKAEEKLNKVSKRSKQFHLRFDRVQKGKRYKTTVKIERGDRNYSGNNHGLLHRAVNLKNRVTGDAPSLTKTIDSIQPETVKGKIAKGAAKAVNTAGHAAVHTAVNTGLAAETLTLNTADAVQNEVTHKLRQKYTQEAVDDGHRGTIAAARIAFDAVNGTRRHLTLKRQNRVEKAKYKIKRAENKLFVHEKYKPESKELNKKLNESKEKFKEHRKNFENSSGTNLDKAIIKRRKQAFKQNKRELKFEKKQLKNDKKYHSKELKNQKKIASHSKPGLLVLKPAQYTAGRIRASAWQKAVNEESENDALHAVDSAKRRITDPAARNLHHNNQLRRNQNKRDRLSDSKDKSSNRLRKQDNKLKEKHNAPQKKKRLQNQRKNKVSAGERFKEGIKAFLRFVKNIYEQEAKKFFLFLLLFILIGALILSFVLMIFSSVLGGSGFILGTYTAQDYDLSEAEKYYTRLAWDMNQKILKVGTDDWKKGLQELGIDTGGMKTKPDEKRWGYSDRFQWNPEYDFDVWKLWAFLCAYNYDFSVSNGDIKYWKFNSSMESLVKEIFDAEYEFVYRYDNSSRWEELGSYNYFGGGNCYDGSYYTATKDVYIYDGEPYRYRFKPSSCTHELSQYCDGDGFICIAGDLRVLNPHDSYEPTGFMVMDNRWYSGSSEPFYYYDGSNDKFFFMTGSDRHDRTFWGWGGEQAWFLVSPDDTLIWNSGLNDTCLFGYYEKYRWVQDCKLSYNVKKKKSFDDVLKDKLNGLSDSGQRIEYYNLLAGNEAGMSSLYGNHQTLKNILSGDSLKDYDYTNTFGWDMQEWNTVHCSIDDEHLAVDVKCSDGADVYAPFKCKIKDIDTDKHTIVLRKDDVLYWYDGSHGTKRDTEVTIKNADLISGFSKGDTIDTGTVFAKTNNTYIHLKVNIDTDGFGWSFVDPRLVFY
ncbi:MAG: hypothetical protein ACI4KB_12855 [Oscillospiraceae bacterium]